MSVPRDTDEGEAGIEPPHRGNALLTRVMLRLRHDRPPLDRCQSFYVRLDRSMGGTFAQLWFLTRGCTWDRQGSCTMCNYGHTGFVDPDEMVSLVRRGLESIDTPLSELYVSPSGSLLDPVEVPAEARRGILKLVRDFPVGRFSLESRAETITAGAVDEVVAALPNKRIAVGLGLESSDPWVLRFCINKPGQPETFVPAAALLRSRGVSVYANVSLGPAFLTAGEAVDDAVHSVKWALDAGADLVLLFPLHAKTGTLLAWLYGRGLYEPPSLWSLVEVLRATDPEMLPRVNISWYRSDYGANPGVIASPTTCPDCEARVLTALDRFREAPSAESLGPVLAQDCSCRSLWREAMVLPPDDRATRVLSHYQRLADEFGLREWWRDHAAGVALALAQAGDSP